MGSFYSTACPEMPYLLRRDLPGQAGRASGSGGRCRFPGRPGPARDLPPMVRSTPSQPESSAVATARAGVPGPARNVSTRLPPKSAGQLKMPGGNSARPLISAASLRTCRLVGDRDRLRRLLAALVRARGPSRSSPPWRRPGPSRSPGGRAARSPGRRPGSRSCRRLAPTVTTSSRESSTAAMAGSETIWVQVVDCRGRSRYRCRAARTGAAGALASQASTLCGAPGAIHHSALSTRSGVAGVWAGDLSTPSSTAGAADGRRAPAGTANEARIASASATARWFGVCAFAGDSADVSGTPVDPVRALAGSVAVTVPQPDSATAAAALRARAARAVERPTAAVARSLMPIGRRAGRARFRLTRKDFGPGACLRPRPVWWFPVAGVRVEGGPVR